MKFAGSLMLISNNLEYSCHVLEDRGKICHENIEKDKCNVQESRWWATSWWETYKRFSDMEFSPFSHKTQPHYSCQLTMMEVLAFFSKKIGKILLAKDNCGKVSLHHINIVWYKIWGAFFLANTMVVNWKISNVSKY